MLADITLLDSVCVSIFTDLNSITTIYNGLADVYLFAPRMEKAAGALSRFPFRLYGKGRSAAISLKHISARLFEKAVL